MGSKGGGTNTVQTQSAPPQQFLDAYSNAQTQAQQVASTPYQSYPGQTVAQFSPDQQVGMDLVEGMEANGGVYQPYINQAQTDFTNATQPLLTPQLQQQLDANSGSALVPATANAVSGIQGAANTGTSGILGATNAGTAGVQNATAAGTAGISGATNAAIGGVQGATAAGMSGVTGAANTGVSGITGATNTGTSGITNAASGLTPESVNQWESPYTQQVVGATQAEFNNQNAQQQAQVAGNAISQGAFGGDRAAVASALTTEQQQLAQAPVIANLENQGYTTALGAAQQQAGLQTQAATSAGSLGLQGATSAASTGLQGATTAAGLGLQGETTAGQLGQTGATSAAGLGLQGATTSGSLGLQGQSTAGSLGLQGATSAGQAGMTGATTESQLGLQGAQVGLGANEANAWLNSQAAFGEANLGSQEQQLGLTGANSLISSGALQQQMAQENLNVPYEQYLAAQAYPFQTAQFGANIAEGLGGASGGTSSTTSPAASEVSQIAGLGAGGLGILGATGGFGSNGYLSSLGSSIGGLFGSGAGESAAMAAADAGGAFATEAAGTAGAAGLASGTGEALGLLAGVKRGGGLPRRDAGGATDGVTVSVQPNDPTQGGMVGADPSQPWYAPLVQENLSSQMAASLSPPGTDPTSDAAGMKSGGMLPLMHPKHFDVGGFSGGMESPWWERSEARGATDRHGLLTSPIAGRTDKLAVSPAAGSYVIPADVVSGLGEGNTLAGANVMQKILETGPHGMPLSQSRGVKEMPHPPPAYREGEGDDGMAEGGEVGHFASGGMSLSPASAAYINGNGLGGFGLPSGNGTYSPVPSTGINASTGQGTSSTGNALRDNYLNSTEAGARFTTPMAGSGPAAPAASGISPAAAATPPALTPAEIAWAGDPANPVSPTYSPTNTGGGGQASGGRVKRFADAGAVTDDLVADDEGGSWDDGSAASSGMGPRMSLGFTPPTMSGEPPPDALPGDRTQGMGMGRPPPPHSAMRPHSDIDAGGMSQSGPPPPPPPAGASRTPPSQSSHDSDFDKYLSKLHPSQPDPWLDLAMAGFATAAGKSPHALENIGAGAEKGVAMYAGQKQEAAKEGLQAGETAERMADTQAYREGTLGIRQQNANTSSDRVAAAQVAKQAEMAYKASGLDEKTAHDRATEDLASGRLDAQISRWGTLDAQGQARIDQGGQRIAQGNRRLDQGDQTLDMRRQTIQGTDDYRQFQRELAQSKLSQSQQQNVLTRAVTLSASTGWPLAKSKQQIMQEFPNAASPPTIGSPAPAGTVAPASPQGQNGGFQFPP